MKVLFITDSASDLQPSHVHGKPIVIVPSQISIGNRRLSDFYDISAQDYWKLLRTSECHPSTSMAPPFDYLEAYKTARKKGYTHICVTQVSSTASGTMNSALMARDMLHDEGIDDIDVEIIDTRSYSMAYGHTVLEGVKMAAEDVPFDKIIARIRRLCQKAEIIFGAFTLKYLRRCGRVSGAAAFAGEMLGLRPILLAAGGEVRAIDKVRGDKNVLDSIVKYVKERRNSAEKFMGIIHADVPQEVVSRLERLLEDQLGIKNLPKFIMGSAVTTNAGPDIIGVLYYA